MDGIASNNNKKKEMLEKELAMLKAFYERRAITKENYEKGVEALEKELSSIVACACNKRIANNLQTKR